MSLFTDRVLWPFCCPSCHCSAHVSRLSCPPSPVPASGALSHVQVCTSSTPTQLRYPGLWWRRHHYPRYHPSRSPGRPLPPRPYLSLIPLPFLFHTSHLAPSTFRAHREKLQVARHADEEPWNPSPQVYVAADRNFEFHKLAVRIWTSAFRLSAVLGACLDISSISTRCRHEPPVAG